MRPFLHYTPKKNWCNDPNGLVYFNNEYHMYYQYFPYGKEWGTMHWGHAVSPDLVNFKECDIALFPTIKEDMNGVFSGSSIVYKDELNIFYTGVRYQSFKSNNIHVPKYKDDFLSSQIKIVTKDGYSFDNFKGKHIVLAVSDDAKVGHPVHMRDPKVWQQDDNFYMILGTTTEDEKSGKVNIYKSKDLKSFDFLCSYTKNDYGNMWECPDYFVIGGNQYLIMSPENFVDNGLYFSQATIQRANFDLESEKFYINEEYEFLDYGLDVYAPQTFLDEYGMRTLICWIRMPKYHAKKNDYVGSYTLPRTMVVRDGEICYEIHPNIQKQFIGCNDFSVDQVIKIIIQMENENYLNIGGYLIKYNNKLEVDRTSCFSLREGVLLSTPNINKDIINLEIVIDQNIVELFIDDGRFVITNYIDGISNIIDTNVKNDLLFFKFSKDK